MPRRQQARAEQLARDLRAHHVGAGELHRARRTWVSVACTSVTAALVSAPVGGWKRMSAVPGAPNALHLAVVQAHARAGRRGSGRGRPASGVGAASITVPPLKSMPRFRPLQGGMNGERQRPASRAIARIDRRRRTGATAARSGSGCRTRQELDQGPESHGWAPLPIGRVFGPGGLEPPADQHLGDEDGGEHRGEHADDRVQAKPFTGPEPRWNMISAEIRVVMLASKIETRRALKPASIERRSACARRAASSRIRS